MSSSSSTAEQPLQSLSAATGNIQQAQEPVSTKASRQAPGMRPVSTGAEDVAIGNSTAADIKESKQEAQAPIRDKSKLFDGHEVTSFVVEEEDNSSIHDDQQQTVSTTPYDELD